MALERSGLRRVRPHAATRMLSRVNECDGVRING